MKIYFENILSLIFAILILFEFKMETEVRAFMNTVVGMISCFVLLIFMFICFNPLTAILFLIYFYENVKFDEIHSKIYDENTKPNILRRLQSSVTSTKNEKDEVEIETIQKMAPIVKKPEKSNVAFKPHSMDSNNWSTL